MLSTHFFADPHFLELLAFWDESRGGRPLPDWSGDMAVFPRGVLPYLIVSDRRSGQAIYRYVGAECVRRWGSDPTGQVAYGTVLHGAHARYLQSLGRDVMAHRAPVFSTAVYQPDAASMLMTGRLHTPFTYQGTREPCVLVTLQLFTGSERDLQTIGIAGVVDEVRRYLIADVPTVCARLAEARRSYQIARHTHGRTLVRDIDALLGQLAGGALVQLPCWDDPGDPPDPA